MALTRISITLPRDLLTLADRRARELDRSRSWVLAEALRAYLGGAGVDIAQGATSAVREPSHPVYVYAAREVAEARRRHLAADLALSPGERLRRAEELTRLARIAQRGGRRHQVIAFDSYEDYYEWKRARLAEV